MSPGEISGLGSWGWVGEVTPQHILFHVTLEIINPMTLTDANLPFRNPGQHSHCTALWEKGVSLSLLFGCTDLGSPEAAPTSTLGSQEPRLMAAFPPR